MRRILAMLLALGTAVSVWSQNNDPGFPSFNEYPAGKIFKGKPALPRLGPGDRMFRTRIREGAAAGPNFAGHLSIAERGCGSSCVSFAIIDAETGKVYPGPFVILGYAGLWNFADVSESSYEPLSFKLDSRLFIARGCPEDENCASYFYEWKVSSFRLIRKIPAKRIIR